MKSRLCKAVSVAVSMGMLPAMVFSGNLPNIELPGGVATHKNIIVLVPDGCGTAHTTVSRWFKGDSLAVDKMEGVGLAHTWMSNSVVTGSAAAGTAFACGYKTNVLHLGCKPSEILVPEEVAVSDADRNHPVASILEGARLLGKATGLIATSDFRHATPAAFASHWYYRNSKMLLAQQMAHSMVDVLLAGGYKYIDDNPNGFSMTDLGYNYIKTLSEFTSLDTSSAQKVWGLFAADALKKELDRQYLGAEEPSIADMTRSAISILSKDPQGFFLMVEGSQVDWASHGNDPVGVVTDFVAWDEAVQVALDFAESDGQTMVLAFPDHDNGGMSLYSDDRFGDNPSGYTDVQVDKVIEPLKQALMTADGLSRYLNDTTGHGGVAPIENADSIRFYVDSLFGITLTADEISDIMAGGDLEEQLGDAISLRSYIGWTTDGHTGNDVPVWAHGLDFALGTVDNTDIANIIFDAFGVDKDSLNARLFVEATAGFTGAEVTIDTAGHAWVEKGMNTVDGGTLTVVRGEDRAEFELNKSTMTFNGEVHQLEGLVVYEIETHRVFVPQQAIDIFNNDTPVNPSLGMSTPKRGTVRIVGGSILVAPRDTRVSIFSLNGALLKRIDGGAKVDLSALHLGDGAYVVRTNNRGTKRLSKVNGSFSL